MKDESVVLRKDILRSGGWRFFIRLIKPKGIDDYYVLIDMCDGEGVCTKGSSENVSADLDKASDDYEELLIFFIENGLELVDEREEDLYEYQRIY